MEIKTAGLYSLGFLAGVSGIATIGGLTLALYGAIKSLVYKILVSLKFQPGKRDHFEREIKSSKNLIFSSLIISIPIVGALVFVDFYLSKIKNNDPKLILSN